MGREDTTSRRMIREFCAIYQLDAKVLLSRSELLLESYRKICFARCLDDEEYEDEDGDMDETVERPVEDETVAFGVSEDLDRDIQQPQAITGVRVIAVGNGKVAGTATLTRN